MREDEFKERFQQAVGPAPNINRARLEAALAGPSRPSRSLALGSIAATLALVAVAGFAGWRLVGPHTSPAASKRSPVAATPTPAISVVNAGAPVCRMPVVVTLESGPPDQLQMRAGFINTGTGQYTADSSASVAGLPGGGFIATKVKPSRPSWPAFYSESLHRWLPVDKRSVSPDGASYVWERLLPEGSDYSNFRQSELHRYDVATSTDRTLWTYAGSIDLIRWDASGILLDTVPANGGVPINWLINPATGDATQQASGYDTQPRITQLPGDPLQNGGFAYGNVPGAEFRGHPVFRIGSREPGTRELVVYETAPGQRVTIYEGTQGDAIGFDPESGLSDAAGIWFTDYSGRVLWRWQPATGLHKVALAGLPAPLAGPNSSVYAPGGDENPAGDCVPLK